MFKQQQAHLALLQHAGLQAPVVLWGAPGIQLPGGAQRGAKQKNFCPQNFPKKSAFDAAASSLIHQFSSKINKGTSKKRFNSHLLEPALLGKVGSEGASSRAGSATR